MLTPPQEGDLWPVGCLRCIRLTTTISWQWDENFRRNLYLPLFMTFSRFRYMTLYIHIRHAFNFKQRQLEKFVLPLYEIFILSRSLEWISHGKWWKTRQSIVGVGRLKNIENSYFNIAVNCHRGILLARTDTISSLSLCVPRQEWTKVIM